MSGKFWRVWAGARNGPQDVLGNATRKRSAFGKGRTGPRLKKSAQRRAHDRLRRRKRIEPAAASVSHVGAPRANPILEFNFNWKSLSAVAGLTFLSFYFRLYAGAVKSPVIDFLQALVQR